MGDGCFLAGVWVGFSAALLPSMLVLAWMLLQLPADDYQE